MKKPHTKSLVLLLFLLLLYGVIISIIANFSVLLDYISGFNREHFIVLLISISLAILPIGKIIGLKNWIEYAFVATSLFILVLLFFLPISAISYNYALIIDTARFWYVGTTLNSILFGIVIAIFILSLVRIFFENLKLLKRLRKQKNSEKHVPPKK